MSLRANSDEVIALVNVFEKQISDLKESHEREITELKKENEELKNRIK